jgi:FMN phosphatase YigB (HAD superfamily)
LDQLQGDPSECVYVGDNWLADVQGSKGMGMKSILTTEHLPYKKFDHNPGDFEPDKTIGRISELRALFL